MGNIGGKKACRIGQTSPCNDAEHRGFVSTPAKVELALEVVGADGVHTVNDNENTPIGVVLAQTHMPQFHLSYNSAVFLNAQYFSEIRST